MLLYLFESLARALVQDGGDARWRALSRRPMRWLTFSMKCMLHPQTVFFHLHVLWLSNAATMKSSSSCLREPLQIQVVQRVRLLKSFCDPLPLIRVRSSAQQCVSSTRTSSVSLPVRVSQWTCQGCWTNVVEKQLRTLSDVWCFLRMNGVRSLRREILLGHTWMWNFDTPHRSMSCSSRPSTKLGW